MKKDIELGFTFCEHRDCTNMAGWAGALVENPTTHQRVLCCLPCLKNWYVGWKVLLKWRQP